MRVKPATGYNMLDYSDLYRSLQGTPLQPWLDTLPDRVRGVFCDAPHGDLQRWLSVLRGLPDIRPSRIDLSAAAVSAGASGDSDAATRQSVEDLLRQLHPWRKGPYRIMDIPIDAEWRSDWKWERLQDWIRPLDDRLVLDVGCGNGYHCWRSAGAGARLTIGIDPSLLCAIQFHAVKHFMGNRAVHLLPLGIEDMPRGLGAFDTLFSMGVLYHRRSPLDHLLELHGCLRNGGELVLETLVIEGSAGQVLVPEGRYAKMRNVWFIPSCATLLSWLTRCGFRNGRVIDLTFTSPDEQRSTDWMRFQSLRDFLHPHNPELTIEGMPAPCRGIFLAEKAD